MIFDIDVSGEDILSRDYTICISNNNNIITGFKMENNLVSILSSRYGQGLYRYEKSKKGKTLLKIRVYCIAIYYLFKLCNSRKNVILNICRDFYGKEKDIENNLRFFIESKLGMTLDKLNFCRLSKDSHAHKYAFLMRKDIKNKMNTYVKLSVKDFEEFLK